MAQMEDSPVRKVPYQIHQSYIISQIKSGFLLIDQQYAHERILYEKYLNQIENQEAQSQRLLFPKTLSLAIHEAMMVVGSVGFFLSAVLAGEYLLNRSARK